MGAGSVRRFLESFLALTFCDSTLLEQNNAHKMRTGWINPLQTNVSCRAVMFEIIVLTASYCWQHPSQYFLVWYNAGKMKHLEFFFSINNFRLWVLQALHSKTMDMHFSYQFCQLRISFKFLLLPSWNNFLDTPKRITQMTL